MIPSSGPVSQSGTRSPSGTQSEPRWSHLCKATTHAGRAFAKAPCAHSRWSRACFRSHIEWPQRPSHRDKHIWCDYCNKAGRAREDIHDYKQTAVTCAQAKPVSVLPLVWCLLIVRKRSGPKLELGRESNDWYSSFFLPWEFTQNLCGQWLASPPKTIRSSLFNLLAALLILQGAIRENYFSCWYPYREQEGCCFCSRAQFQVQRPWREKQEKNSPQWIWLPFTQGDHCHHSSNSKQSPRLAILKLDGKNYGHQQDWNWMC